MSRKPVAVTGRGLVVQKGSEMLDITLIGDSTARLYSILKEEDDNACVRIREFKVGTSCNMNLKIVLGLSIDERDEDDLEGEAATLPFVMNRELADQYGTRFTIFLDAYRAFDVVPARSGYAPRSASATEQEERIFWASPVILP